MAGRALLSSRRTRPHPAGEDSENDLQLPLRRLDPQQHQTLPRLARAAVVVAIVVAVAVVVGPLADHRLVAPCVVVGVRLAEVAAASDLHFLAQPLEDAAPAEGPFEVGLVGLQGLRHSSVSFLTSTTSVVGLPATS
jgi:hypothetical protein